MMAVVSPVATLPEMLAADAGTPPADAGFAALLAQATPAAVLLEASPAGPASLPLELPVEPDPVEPDDAPAVDDGAPSDQPVEVALPTAEAALPLVAPVPIFVPPAPRPAAAKAVIETLSPEIAEAGTRRPAAAPRVDDLPDTAPVRQHPPITDENRALFAAMRPPVIVASPPVVPDAPSPVTAAVAPTPAPTPGISVASVPGRVPATDAVAALAVEAAPPVAPGAPPEPAAALQGARDRPVVSATPTPTPPGRARKSDAPQDALSLLVVGAPGSQTPPPAPVPTPAVAAPVAPSASPQDAAPRFDPVPPADPAAPVTARIHDTGNGFDLSTDRLGTVRVALEARDTRIGVQFVVETLASAALLGSQAPRLADAVASGGGRLDALSVDVCGSGGNSGGRDTPTRSSARATRPPATPLRQLASTGLPEVPHGQP